MGLFFVVIDFRTKAGTDEVLAKIKSMAGRQVLSTLWAMRSTLTADDIRNTLKPYLHDQDGLFVIEEKDWSGLRTMINLNEM